VVIFRRLNITRLSTMPFSETFTPSVSVFSNDFLEIHNFQQRWAPFVWSEALFQAFRPDSESRAKIFFTKKMAFEFS
jgi:hypothetical protein